MPRWWSPAARARKRPPSPRARAPDGEARYAKKHGKSYYGYKAHISADGDNQLVCRALITPANVDDSRIFAPLLEGKPRAVYADRMYDSAANRAALAERGSANGIMRKGGNHRPVSAGEQARNARKNRRRRNIERPILPLSQRSPPGCPAP